MIDFALTRTTTAPLEAVFDAASDHRSTATYTWAIRRSTLDREGTPAPNGVGALRRLASYGTTFVEEIVTYDRPARLAYSVRSGIPLQDHLGTIDVRRVGAATEVSWHVRATSKLPGIEWLLTPASKLLIGGWLDGILAAAERRG